MHATLTPNGFMFKLQHRERNCTSGGRCRSPSRMRVLVSPQTVIETLHAILGHTIWATKWADPPKHAGDVHHSAPGQLNERQDAQGDINNSTQIDGQHEFIIVNGEPVSRGRRQRDPCVVHNSPETYSNTTTAVQLSQDPNMEPLHWHVFILRETRPFPMCEFNLS